MQHAILRHMLTRHTRDTVTWIDLESPTPEELSQTVAEFSLDAKVKEEIIAPTPYPLSVAYERYLYFVLHFPTADPEGGAKSQEVDFIIGKNFLITVRYEVVASLHALHRAFEAEELLGISSKKVSAGMLLERILEKLYGAIGEEIEDTARILERIERDIFDGKERQTVRKISAVARVLLRFDTTLARHGELMPPIIKALAGTRYFGPSFIRIGNRIEARRVHIEALVASYRQVVAELRVTNDSQLSASQNEVMKTLTVITVAVLPPSLIISLFEMNSDSVPLHDSAYGFWIIGSLTLVLCGGFIILSKRKGWL